MARLQGVYRWWLARTTRIRTARAPLIAALFLAVALLAALWQIDGILRAIHRPGDAAYGIGALSDPGMPPPESGRAGHVTAAWSAGRVRGFTGPDTLAYWYVALDVLFIVAYSWILVVVLAGIRERLRDDTTEATFATAAERHAASGAAARSVTAEAQRIGRLAARYARLMGLASAGVVVLALVDLLEDALQVYAVAHCVRDNAPHDCVEWQLTWALYLVTTLKWLLSAAVLVPALLGVFVLASLHRRQARELARVLVRVRAPLAVVLLLGFAYLVKASPFADQAADLLRRWKDEWWQGVIGALLTALLAAVILSFARWLVAVERKAAADPAGALWIATAVAVVLGGVAAVWPGGTGLLVLAGLLLAIAVLSALAGTVDDDPPPSAADAYGATAVPALLAAAPLVALGLAVQGAALGEIAWAGNAGYVVWLVVGLVLQALGWGAYFWARPAHAVSGLLAGLGGLVVVVVAVWTWVDPWGAGDIGGAGIIATFAIAMTVIAGGLGLLAERYAPPSAIRLVGLRRMPYLVLLVAWGFGAAVVDTHSDVHDARLLGAAGKDPVARPGFTVQVLFDRWVAQQDLRGAGHPTPLVIVSASGGGIRAAYWTAHALDCVFGDVAAGGACPGAAPSSKPVIALSGVSGGSLGLTSWATHVRNHDDTPDWLITLEEDTLSPTLAWALFADLPNSLLHTGRVPDRAEILERSWEREWVDGKPRDSAALDANSPLAKGLFATGADPPALMLNGTAVESGCRLNVSVVNDNVEQDRPNVRIADCLSVRTLESGAPAPARTDYALGASVDVNRYLCGKQDLRLSTAALLSARFPYVSPSGRLRDCADPETISTYIVDGGYFDSSAAGTATELWTALEPIVARYNAANGQCVVPFAIQIDNGYDELPGPDPAKRPQESIVPLKTIMGGRDAGEADARQSLALAVSKPVGDVRRVLDATGEEERRYAHVYPRAHPGTQAPLGWALSKATQQDLADQLNSNAGALTAIRDRWLKPDALTCERDPAG